MTGHIATDYAAHGDRESAESLVRNLLPWARRSVLPEPKPEPKRSES